MKNLITLSIFMFLGVTHAQAEICQNPTDGWIELNAPGAPTRVQVKPGVRLDVAFERCMYVNAIDNVLETEQFRMVMKAGAAFSVGFSRDLLAVYDIVTDENQSFLKYKGQQYGFLMYDGLFAIKFYPGMRLAGTNGFTRCVPFEFANGLIFPSRGDTNFHPNGQVSFMFDHPVLHDIPNGPQCAQPVLNLGGKAYPGVSRFSSNESGFITELVRYYLIPGRGNAMETCNFTYTSNGAEVSASCN